MGDDGDARVFLEPPGRPKAGVISKIRMENFMCHSNLEIELGEWVNFITGQNGSGKSAILTALCVAFGCRAKGTQRASTLKDFIKTGCSSAMVQVYLKNSGEDAFKPEIYGDIITVERRISESTSSMQLKDCQGRKVATRKEELRELVEHFNIDVENPCVIMSQDKSREFLHSGNSKDKFKATLLQHVNDLLQSIRERLDSANALIEELECTIRPIEKELSELHDKIKAMERIEELSQQAQVLKKKLAWAWVYDVDRQLREQSSKIEKLKGRIPACQAKIDEQLNILQKLRQHFTEKKIQIGHLMAKTSEVKRKKSELQHSLSLAKREKHELAQEYDRENNNIQKMAKHVSLLQQEIQEMQEQHLKETQDEEVVIEANLRELQSEVDATNLKLRGLNEEENALSQNIQMKMDEIQRIFDEIADFEKRQREIYNHIRELRQHKTNKVTAFGGEKVIQLLRAIERHRNKFTRPPIGPIGAHLTLTHDDWWAPAVENAIGWLLNAFIVTNHGDSLTLGRCAKEANYTWLRIIIYDFSRPRLKIPYDMLPQTEHPTTLSVLESDNDTVLNVLVDLGNVERQVLVRDYEVGTKVTFEQNIPNLKEVHTLDGYKMFYRGSVQTVLPPNKKARTGRLCSSFDNQIEDLEREAKSAKEQADVAKKRKREAESFLCHLKDNLENVKRRCKTVEWDLASKNLALGDLKSTKIAGSSSSMSTVDELHQEISKIQDEIREKETLLEKISIVGNDVDMKVHDLQLSFKELCESTKMEIDLLEDSEKELMQIESNIHSVEAEKRHYEGVMSNKVLSDINVAEAHHKELKHKRTESCRKASIICPESEIEALGEWDGSTPEQLSAQLNTLKQRLLRENQQCSDSIEDLRMLYDKKKRKISRKQETYKGFREKLEACQRALELRWDKFQRNATLLKRQLTWQFNAHLAKKGISGLIKVSYEDKTLSVEVRMPQDSSSGTVRDTRGLSGGERSFSTLCFALALHEMTEAPFRAMDEFDVFMDAVSRKISLDTLVDFALVHGSQWIFITPHDISMVKHGERIRKQQMAAPRS